MLNQLASSQPCARLDGPDALGVTCFFECDPALHVRPETAPADIGGTSASSEVKHPPKLWPRRFHKAVMAVMVVVSTLWALGAGMVDPPPVSAQVAGGLV